MNVPLILAAVQTSEITSTLESDLRGEGFDVYVVTPSDLLTELSELRPSVVLLGTGSALDDLELCRSIRRATSTPIIVLSSSRDADAAESLNVGADDYVATPYRRRELVARIRAMLRRAPVDPAPDTEEPAVGPITVGSITLDAEAHTVAIDDVPLQLPLKEFDLLHLLMLNAGRVMSRSALVNRVWGRDYYGDTKTLDVHVLRLRRKIERLGAAPAVIATVRGVGYRFEKPAHAVHSPDAHRESCGT